MGKRKHTYQAAKRARLGLPAPRRHIVRVGGFSSDGVEEEYELSDVEFREFLALLDDLGAVEVEET